MSDITTAGKREDRQFVNKYRCPCGHEWEDQWDCKCNDRCPTCDKEIEPYESELIPEEDPRPVENPTDPVAVLAELRATRERLFDLANAHAGNDKGNAALYLHGACNELVKAIKCIERGNPNEPFPLRYVLASMGITSDEASPT